MKINQKTKAVVALDVPDLARARYFLNTISGVIGIIKIGPVLFTAYGPKAVEMARRKGVDVFLDLKFHDIPNTVANAVRQAVRLKVKMLTLHICGGEEMMKRAAQAAQEEARLCKAGKPVLLGITVLTSDACAANTKTTVVARARLAKKCGLDGVVCSVYEAAAVRKACGKRFVIVTPGIRPGGAGRGDQKRVASAQDAVRAGADYIVVGRPVLEADDPRQAAQDIIKEIG